MAINATDFSFVDYKPIEDNVDFIKEYGEKTDKAFADALMTGASARELLNTLDPNLSPKTKELIESYAINAENLAGYIAKNGFNPNVNRQIAALARDYASDIAPLKAKYEDFVKRRDEEDARFDKDAQLQKVGRRLNTYSLDEIFFNPDIRDTRELSTSKLHDAAKAMMTNLVNRTGKSHSWSKQIYNLVEEMGQKGVRSGTKGGSYDIKGEKFTNTNLEAMLDKLRRGEGANDEDKEYFGALYESMQDLKREFKLDDFSPEQQRLFDDAIISGIWDGIDRHYITTSTDNTSFKPYNDRSGNGNKKTTDMFDGKLELYNTNNNDLEKNYNNIINNKGKVLSKKEAENNYIIKNVLKDNLFNFLDANSDKLGVKVFSSDTLDMVEYGLTGLPINSKSGRNFDADYFLKDYPVTNIDFEDNKLIFTINGKQVSYDVPAQQIGELQKIHNEANEKFKDVYEKIGHLVGKSLSKDEFKNATKDLYVEYVPYIDVQHNFTGIDEKSVKQAIGSISKAELKDGKFELQDGIYMYNGRAEDFSLRSDKLSKEVDLDNLNYGNMKIAVFTKDAAIGLYFGKDHCIVIPAENIDDYADKKKIYQIQEFYKGLTEGPADDGYYYVVDKNLNPIQVNEETLNIMKHELEQDMLQIAERKFGLKKTTHDDNQPMQFTNNSQ